MPRMMPFGRWKNQPVRSIPKWYASWLLKECDLDDDLRAEVQAVVDDEASPELLEMAERWLAKMRKRYGNERHVEEGHRILLNLIRFPARATNGNGAG